MMGVERARLGLLEMDRGQLEQGLREVDGALSSFRELGDRQAEAYLLAALAAREAAAGRVEDGRAHAEKALRMAHELGDRIREGAILGTLGCLRFLRDEPGAREALTRGEALLRETGAQLELAVLLCERAVLDQADGQEEAWEQALSEAQAIVVRTGVGPRSRLRRALDRARYRLGVSPAPAE